MENGIYQINITIKNGIATDYYIIPNRIGQKRKIELTKLLKNPEGRLTKYLNKICDDSGGCLVFGRESERVKNLFHGFYDFKYAINPIKKINVQSTNGFIYGINYEQDDYEASAILKLSQKKSADNLYYEYLVGKQFINEQNFRFPCFTETYHFLLSNTLLRNIMMNQEKIDILKIKNNIEFLDVNYKGGPLQYIIKSCTEPENLAILVQYIKEPISFSYHMKTGSENSHYESEMIQLFYQIYGPLSILKDQFTHYDLHTNNVLLYKLKTNNFIKIKYVFKDGEVEFKTHLIAKIIDYGRSFFHKDEKLNSEVILRSVCDAKECNIEKSCGNNLGYGWMNKRYYYENNYLCSSILNASYDLRLADIYKIYFNAEKINSKFLKSILDDLYYEIPGKGTPPKDSVKNSGKIYNTTDMEIRLKEGIKFFKKENDDMYEKQICVGELTVFMDGKKDMVFVGENIYDKFK